MADQGESAPRIASYEADPEAVGRILLLYSGGLDTSVMLKWIQERYGAEIVTLTVNLGQPGEDWGVVTGKAEQLGAVKTLLVDALSLLLGGKPDLPPRKGILGLRHAHHDKLIGGIRA